MSSVPPMLTKAIADHLDEIRAYFKAPKVTLVIRNPAIPEGEGDVLLTDDELPQVFAAIQRLQAREEIPVW